MIKKFFLLLILPLFSLNSALAILPLSENDYKNFKKSLRLNKTQKIKMEEIELSAEKEKETYYKQLRENISNDNRRELQRKIYQIDLNKEKEILKILNPKQQSKYKEFNSRVY